MGGRNSDGRREGTMETGKPRKERRETENIDTRSVAKDKNREKAKQRDGGKSTVESKMSWR